LFLYDFIFLQIVKIEIFLQQLEFKIIDVPTFDVEVFYMSNAPTIVIPNSSIENLVVQFEDVAKKSFVDIEDAF